MATKAQRERKARMDLLKEELRLYAEKMYPDAEELSGMSEPECKMLDAAARRHAVRVADLVIELGLVPAAPEKCPLCSTTLNMGHAVSCDNYGRE